MTETKKLIEPSGKEFELGAFASIRIRKNIDVEIETGIVSEPKSTKIKLGWEKTILLRNILNQEIKEEEK